MKTLEDIYREMRSKPLKWNHANIYACVSFEHGTTDDHLMENVELDKWVQQTDHGYPIPTSRSFNSISPAADHFNHDQWINQQHNSTLAQEHLDKLSDDEFNEIRKIHSGGIHFGYDSGSADVTKFLLDQHGKAQYPIEFHRTSHPSKNDQLSEHINLSVIDNGLRKNIFPSEFHSFHGVKFDPKDVIKDRGVLHLPAYTFGSINRNIGLKWSRLNSPDEQEHHVIHMVHPAGSTGLYIGNQRFRDNEVVLPRNLSLHMKMTPTSYKVGDKNVHIWQGHRQTDMEI